MTRPTPTTTIRCDTDGCGARLIVEADLTPDQAATIATEQGWEVKRGTMRDYHRCAGHGGAR